MAAISARETEVLALLGEHLTHAEIADRLVISIRTVESHVASLRRKLDLPAHRDLIRYAVAHRAAGWEPGPVVAPPRPLTSFVGRRRERAELAEALLGARVVSIVGPGGAGKTRLAGAAADDVADRFPAGVWHADLVPIGDDAALAAAVAAACGVADVPGRDSQEALLRGLGDRPALLVLDNCEHLVNAVAVLVERLVSACGQLRVLLTSRSRLALPFERVYRLGGLPPDGDALALFIERAVAAGWPAPTPAQRPRMAGICRALDGLPLAIELAAVRLPSLGLDGVEQGLADHASLLTGGARLSSRQRSMEETLDWSFRLLEQPERAVLCRVSVFAAAFGADAAGAVAGEGAGGPAKVTQALGRLADQSLLVSVPAAGDGRWRLLEPVRQFAASRMSPSDQAAFAAHLGWARGRAEGLLAASGGPGRAWYGDFDDDVDDLRAALRWCAHQPDRRAEASELAEALAALLFRAGRAREAQHRYEQAADLADRPATAARQLAQAAAVARCRVLGEDALRLELAAVAAARRHGDPATLAAALVEAAETILRFEGMFAGPAPEATAEALLEEARALTVGQPRLRAAAQVVLAHRQDPSDPRTRHDVARAVDAAHRAGDPIRESAALDVLTAVQLLAGQPTLAARSARRQVGLFDGRPVDPAAALELKDALHMAVLTCVGAGDLTAATHYGQQQRALAFLREQRDLGIEATLTPDALAGRWHAVLAGGALFLEDWDTAGRPAGSGRAIGPCAVAMVHGLLGDDTARERWLGVVAELRGVERADATRGTGYGELFDALVLLHRDRPDAALAVLDRQDGGHPPWHGQLLHQWRAALAAEAAVLAAAPDAPRRCAAAERTCAGNPVAAALTRRACTVAASDTPDLVALAAHLSDAGAPYQAARTLILAGGPYRATGEARLAHLAA
jgi:predicted ATPase/DNA-binding CsgD family transcriptional regulator